MSRAAVAIATGLLVLGATATAGASSNGDNGIDQHFQTAGAQFTDCPSTPPAVETLCHGVDVNASRVDGEVADHETRSTSVAVTVVRVHLFPDGTFTINPTPITTGNAPLRFRFDDLSFAKISGNVPLDDGTVAVIDVTLKPAGPVSSSHFTGNFPVPECPSGTGHVEVNQHFRDAAAQGSATIHGHQLVPTSAVQPPFLFDEVGEGNCLP